MTSSNNGRRRHWLLVIGYSLFAVAVASCGGGNNAPVAPEAASLEGDRRANEDEWTPAVDITKAPTKIHGELAKLVPNLRGALVADSVRYGNWNAETAGYDLDEPEAATLHMVMADYRSAGYEIEKDADDRVRVEFDNPQRCRLTLVRAPEAAAAPVIGEKIVAKLEGNNFVEISQFAGTGGTKDNIRIRRFWAVVPQEKHDDVYVAYLLVAGDTVVYALESEIVDKIAIDDETYVSRVEKDGVKGSRVGAGLVVLVDHLLGES